jgi:hypothetical protein
MAIVKNKKTDFLYRYLGDNVFRNIATGVEGKVTDEAAQKTFAIHLEATELCEEYPLIEELIKAANLKYDVCGLSK